MRQTFFWLCQLGLTQHSLIFMISLCLATQPYEPSAQVLDCHNRETFDANSSNLSTGY